MNTAGKKALKPRNGIVTIQPYAQGKFEIPEHPDPIKLSSNESSYGPSPNAIAAYHSAADSLNRYPDGTQSQLRGAIVEVLNLDPDKVICGSGSEELLSLAVRAYVGPGDELLLTENHFIMCPIYGKSQDADVIYAPEKDYIIDVDAVLDCISTKTRMIIIANPNNPTGTYIPGPELRRLHAGIPADVLLIIDEAYAEFVTRDDFESGLELVEQNDNVMVTRTFSKIYGLSGLRIGWAYCPVSVIDILQRIRSPFNTNSAALSAATAAVRDQDYIAAIRRHNAHALEKITKTLSGLGLHVIPSVTNFYLLDFSQCGAKTATQAAEYLESRGIIPRAVSAGTNTNVLRITVGLDEENAAVIKALTEFMQ